MNPNNSQPQANQPNPNSSPDPVSQPQPAPDQSPTSFATGSSSTTPQTPPTAPAPMTPKDQLFNQFVSANAPKPPKSNKKIWLIIGGIATAGVIVAGTLAVVFLNNSDQRNSNPPEIVSNNSEENQETVQDVDIDPNSTANTDIPEQFEFSIYDDSEPGGTTTVSVKNNQVTVSEYHACSAVDCDGATEENTFQFSDENIAKLYQFYESELADLVHKGPNGSEEIIEADLNYHQFLVMQALSLGEKEFSYSVKEPLYIVNFRISGDDDYNYSFYDLNVTKDGTYYVVKTTIGDEISDDEYYELDFSSKNLKIIDKYMNEVINESGAVEDGISEASIEYYEADSSGKSILDAIAQNDESLIEAQ